MRESYLPFIVFYGAITLAIVAVVVSFGNIAPEAGKSRRQMQILIGALALLCLILAARQAVVDWNALTALGSSPR